ncbi:MAG: helicase, partial [Proteobacteria bacterium]|nr:helicase [Pseudomonadota bacterium]
MQYLWPLNPVVRWCNDKGRAAFGRHTAPIVTLLDGLAAEEAAVIVSGLIPNRRSQPLVHRWFVVHFREGVFCRLEDFGDWMQNLQLG